MICGYEDAWDTAPTSSRLLREASKKSKSGTNAAKLAIIARFLCNRDHVISNDGEEKSLGETKTMESMHSTKIPDL